MTDSSNLSPPERGGTTDPGAKDLAESSDTDEHFSDAQSAPISPGQSPVPKTRVEKVDDEPSHGQVPGTDAYQKREEDAEPDEIAIVEDAQSHKASVPASPVSQQSVPKTVVEEAPGSTGEHSAEFLEKRKADAGADQVVKPEGETVEGGNTDVPVSEENTEARPSSPSPRARRKSSKSQNPSGTQTSGLPSEGTEEDDEDAGGDDDFGDDFDDFEEGGDDAEFDDFEDGFQDAEPDGPPTPAPPAAMPPPATLPFAIPDFDGLDAEDIMNASDPHLNSLFPPEQLDLPTLPPPSKDHPVFLTQRSASLWSQLVAPPPLAPPDWIRSRIRRLFLVSLGVPVDLDEILPASKQKKLVLPSLHRKTSTGSLRSSDSRSASRLRRAAEGNASSTSLDSQGNAKRASGRGGNGGGGAQSRKGPPPAPDLDLVAAQQLADTTDEALEGMTDAELKEHVARLKAVEETAKEVLAYWTKRTDEKIGDREAFEGVIENLVKHARKTRK